MSRAKSQPTRKIVDGIEYFSIAAAAEALGRDKRTLTRLEKAGIVPRSEYVLPGDSRQRWYTQADLDLLRRVSDQTGFRTSKNRAKEFVAALAAEKLRRSEGGDKPARSWRHLVERFTSEEVRPKVRRWDDIEDRVDHHDEKTPPQPTCSVCRQELTYRVEKTVPGEPLPWCGEHGFLDLRAPEPPDKNACASCGDELIWELSAEGAFQPVCAACGVVEMPAPSRGPIPDEHPFTYHVEFPMVTVEADLGRPRGLQLQDVVGAVRAPRTQPGPKIMFLDPYER
jgi:hypothetical protein